MARWEVDVIFRLTHHLVIEAPTAEEAQAEALGALGSRPADEMNTDVHVERGVS